MKILRFFYNLSPRFWTRHYEFARILKTYLRSDMKMPILDEVRRCNLIIAFISYENHCSLHMHAKPSFAHRLQTAKMASSRTSAQNNGPWAQKTGPWVWNNCLAYNNCRLATLTVTMLISSCWQLLSEVELRRIFDVCKRWANSGSHEFVKKNMVRYMRPHVRFAHCSCCIFILAVRQPPILASCIEIYYF